MKIRYEFLDGDIQEVEVDAELGALLLDLDRREYNNDHAETRRHSSLNGMDYEGGIFASPANTEAEALLSADIEALGRAMDSLTPAQRELVRKVYFDGQRVSDIARAEGVSHVAVLDRLNRIYRKLKNKF